jgi:hypothetical protein
MADPVNNIVREIPFGLLVYRAAMAIADGQSALDFNSLRTAQTLAETMLDTGTVVMAIVEKVKADGTMDPPELVYNTNPISLLAYGIEPTFYEFSETVIDLRFWVRFYMRFNRVETASSFNSSFSSSYEKSTKKYGGGGGLALNLGFFSIGGGGGASGTEARGKYDVDFAVSSHTAREQQAYGLDAAASCRLTTTLKPKQPAGRIVPQVITQNI